MYLNFHDQVTRFHNPSIDLMSRIHFIVLLLQYQSFDQFLYLSASYLVSKLVRSLVRSLFGSLGSY